MQLLYFCPRWGQEHIEWDLFFKKVKEAGYDGVEASLPILEEERDKFLSGLANYKLQFIGQHWETIDPNFENHCSEYERRLKLLAAAKPLFINSQTGKDYYSFEQNELLISLAQRISSDTGIPIIHETHRGKFSFAAHITKTFLEHIPELNLALDISHWFTVAETFLHDQQAALDLALERTAHIHSRIGFQQGPQVSDPRAPEWTEAVERHFFCWDNVIERQRRAGRKSFTITTEFGPFPYLPLLPYSRQPIADQWEINVYMMNLLKQRYK